MKVLTPGHKYELENHEPNPPSNDVSKGLRKEAYELCLAIKACGCSEQVTKAVTLASELGRKIGIIETGNQTLQFIEKQREHEESTKLITVNNGTTNEEVLAMLIDRLKNLYAKLPSQETADAIVNCEKALNSLNARTKDRLARGVENTPLS